MNDRVRDAQGNNYLLSQEIGAGGQGKVFGVEGHPRLVVKRFHQQLLQGKDSESLRLKVEALREKRLDRKLPQGAWPKFAVFREDGRWCGYAMRKIKGIPLLPQFLLNPLLLEKSYPHIRRPELAALALSFLRAALLLQAEGVKIGDYNPQNFRFDPARRLLGFIDTDAYQVRHKGGFYVCPVTSPEMTPPELLNAPVKRRYRKPENELFAAAILAFLILMPGRHPFDALQSDDCAENLAAGGFPYRPVSGSAGPATGRIPKGIWSRVWEDFPASLQEAFTAIFLTGHRDIKKRGTLAGLIAAVEEYEAGLRAGEHMAAPLFRDTPPAAKTAVKPQAQPKAPKRKTLKVPKPAASASRPVVLHANPGGRPRLPLGERLKNALWHVLEKLTW